MLIYNIFLEQNVKTVVIKKYSAKTKCEKLEAKKWPPTRHSGTPYPCCVFKPIKLIKINNQPLKRIFKKTTNISSLSNTQYKEYFIKINNSCSGNDTEWSCRFCDWVWLSINIITKWCYQNHLRAASFCPIHQYCYTIVLSTNTTTARTFPTKSCKEHTHTLFIKPHTNPFINSARLK